MKTIPLTKGQVALVDDEDYERVRQYKWTASFSYAKYCYARHCFRHPNGKRYFMRLHRVILNMQLSDKRVVDHINHDTLDCRKINLRICTNAQNLHNKRRQENTPYPKGVKYDHGVRRRPFSATITVDGRRLHLGVFATPEKAHAAYCQAAVRYFGEFACFG